MRFYFIFITILLFVSCGDDDALPKIPGTVLNPGDQYKILTSPIPDAHSVNFETDTLNFLALGDSYTIGTGVIEDLRWPNLLADEIRNNSVFISKPEIIAGAGWTTGNLLRILSDRSLNAGFDLVSLLIGVNNQYGGLDFEVFKLEFEQLLEYGLDKAKSRAGIFVLSIPDYGVTPFGSNDLERISEEIDMYNKWIENMCLANNIRFYNVTEISRKAADDLSLLASDNLHPSGKMYLQWIEQIMNDPPGIISR